MKEGEPQHANSLLGRTGNKRTRLQPRLEGETIWLPQARIAETLQIAPRPQTLHRTTIFDEGESDQAATCKA